MIINFRECSPTKRNGIIMNLCSVITGFDNRDWFIVRALEKRLLFEMEYGLMLDADPILRPLEEYQVWLGSLTEQHELSFMKFCEVIFNVEKVEGIKELRTRGIINRYVPEIFKYVRFYSGGVQLLFDDVKVRLEDVYLPYRDSEMFKPIPYSVVREIYQLANTDADLQMLEDKIFGDQSAAVKSGRIAMAKDFVEALRPWKGFENVISENYDDDGMLCRSASALNEETIDDIEHIAGHMDEPIDRSR